MAEEATTTKAPTAAPATEPATAEAAPASAPAATPATPEPVKEQTVPLARLQAVIAQKAETERAREALARELKLANDTLEEFRTLGSKQSDGTASNGQAGQQRASSPKAPSAQELQALVTQEAERQQFDRRCNDSVAEGRKAHQDFDKVVLGDLTSISPVVAQNGRPVLPTSLVEAALETGSGHEVLYALGQDINEASRIMALRPVAQAVELAKFAAKLSASQEAAASGEAPDVSRAPAPIKAPSKGGPVRPHWTPEDTEHFSTEEWIKQREKQIADQRAGR